MAYNTEVLTKLLELTNINRARISKPAELEAAEQDPSENTAEKDAIVQESQEQALEGQIFQLIQANPAFFLSEFIESFCRKVAPKNLESVASSDKFTALRMITIIAARFPALDFYRIIFDATEESSNRSVDLLILLYAVNPPDEFYEKLFDADTPYAENVLSYFANYAMYLKDAWSFVQPIYTKMLTFYLRRPQEKVSATGIQNCIRIMLLKASDLSKEESMLEQWKTIFSFAIERRVDCLCMLPHYGLNIEGLQVAPEQINQYYLEAPISQEDTSLAIKDTLFALSPRITSLAQTCTEQNEKELHFIAAYLLRLKDVVQDKMKKNSKDKSQVLWKERNNEIDRMIEYVSQHTFSEENREESAELAILSAFNLKYSLRQGFEFQTLQHLLSTISLATFETHVMKNLDRGFVVLCIANDPRLFEAVVHKPVDRQMSILSSLLREVEGEELGRLTRAANEYFKQKDITVRSIIANTMTNEGVPIGVLLEIFEDDVVVEAQKTIAQEHVLEIQELLELLKMTSPVPVERLDVIAETLLNWTTWAVQRGIERLFSKTVIDFIELSIETCKKEASHTQDSLELLEKIDRLIILCNLPLYTVSPISWLKAARTEHAQPLQQTELRFVESYSSNPDFEEYLQQIIRALESEALGAAGIKHFLEIISQEGLRMEFVQIVRTQADSIRNALQKSISHFPTKDRPELQKALRNVPTTRLPKEPVRGSRQKGKK